MWRTLTGEEIIQLAKEYERLEAWKKIRQVILDTYGEEAYIIKLTTGEEFNDERFVDIVSSYIVYDRDDNNLGPDYSLPFWQEKKENYPFEEGQDQEGWWFLEGPADEIVSYRLPAYAGSFLLDTPPPISFPEVYVNEPEETQGDVTHG